MKRTPRGRGDSHRRLLSLLQLVQGLRFGWTLTELQQEVGGGEYCTKTIQRDLAKLTEFGFVERVKSQRGWVYRRKESVADSLRLSQ
jgi:predicted DNA-binding transcriptional regulator YafY